MDRVRRDAGCWTTLGESHPGMLGILALSLPSMRPTEVLEPPLFSRASAAAVGMEVPTHLPAYLLHGRCVGGRGSWGERGGCLPSLPPLKNNASGSKIFLLEVRGELQGAFSLCPPRSREAVGGQGRAPGWLEAAAGGWRLRYGQDEHRGSCQGFGGSLARACSWHLLLSRAQAKTQTLDPIS